MPMSINDDSMVVLALAAHVLLSSFLCLAKEARHIMIHR